MKASAVRASVVISALVAVLVGFGSSVAIVLAAADALGATPGQASSWVAAICFAMAATAGYLSVRHRMPIVTAWSTPGAALIATTDGVGMEAGVGAFIFAALLIIATALFRPLSQLMEKIPAGIASAMLAGVLFGFVIAVFGHLEESAALVLPLLIAFVILRLFSASWAVLTVLGLGILLSELLDMTTAIAALQFSSLEWIEPAFEPAVLIGLGLPLYIVTMASQNLPGFAVLKASGYDAPSGSALGVTGLASLVTALAGAHTTNLAAITASICTGPDAHPDKDKRWLCGPVYAAGYLLLGLFGASLVAAFNSFPPALIATVAAIALIGPLTASLAAGLESKDDRFTAAVTFIVTASGISAFGIGAAFWGLVAGLAVMAAEKFRKRLSHPASA